MSVALVIIHNGMRMRHIVICGLSGSTILYHTNSSTARFSKKKKKQKKKLLNIKMVCFDFLYNLFSEKFLILRRPEPYKIINVCRSSFKNSLFLYIEIKFEFSDWFSKIASKPNFTKIRPVGA